MRKSIIRRNIKNKDRKTLIKEYQSLFLNGNLKISNISTLINKQEIQIKPFYLKELDDLFQKEILTQSLIGEETVTLFSFYTSASAKNSDTLVKETEGFSMFYSRYQHRVNVPRKLLIGVLAVPTSPQFKNQDSSLPDNAPLNPWKKCLMMFDLQEQLNSMKIIKEDSKVFPFESIYIMGNQNSDNTRAYGVLSMLRKFKSLSSHSAFEYSLEKTLKNIINCIEKEMAILYDAEFSKPQFIGVEK